ncbi:hypothetical protein HCN44_009247 [Aphidius gifuensis]|uniref:Venom protein n=1 Tax=Aphidius gifuensis TaxID=684658 RepID=A0A835CW12_APHGI|nr:uncharacterized protein LOC122858656 [Aphidius gifuensis]KAF7997849.1 hypothetical protein HCN44_009247 [Aphidius gifuensis]
MNHLITLFFILHASKCILGAVELKDPTQASCFQFTWLRPEYDDNANSTINCSSLMHTPCVKPFIYTNDSTPPNVSYMWQEENRNEISCSMRSDYVCIKYSYIYNQAVVNTTYFCGKMTEDKKIPLTDGCYTQNVDGYTVETCACKSDGGQQPCNSSNQMTVKFRNFISCQLFILGIVINIFL